MKLFEMLQGVEFPPDVKFVSQDEDGVINMYHGDHGQREVTRYWTCEKFIDYLQTEDEEDRYFSLADDYLTALLVLDKGVVVGLADGCVSSTPDVAPTPTEFTIKMNSEDFEYMHDGMEIAELTAGIVNQILREQGIHVVFAIEDSFDDED